MCLKKLFPKGYQPMRRWFGICLSDILVARRSDKDIDWRIKFEHTFHEGDNTLETVEFILFEKKKISHKTFQS